MNDKYNDAHKLPQKLLLTNTLVSMFWKTFANILFTNIKLSKTQLHKIGQSGEFLGRVLGPLLKTGLLLIKKIFNPAAKSVLIPLGLTAATSATDAGLQKNIFWSSTTTSFF